MIAAFNHSQAAGPDRQAGSFDGLFTSSPPLGALNARVSRRRPNADVKPRSVARLGGGRLGSERRLNHAAWAAGLGCLCVALAAGPAWAASEPSPSAKRASPAGRSGRPDDAGGPVVRLVQSAYQGVSAGAAAETASGVSTGVSPGVSTGVSRPVAASRTGVARAVVAPRTDAGGATAFAEAAEHAAAALVATAGQPGSRSSPTLAELTAAGLSVPAAADGGRFPATGDLAEGAASLGSLASAEAPPKSNAAAPSEPAASGVAGSASEVVASEASGVAGFAPAASDVESSAASGAAASANATDDASTDAEERQRVYERSLEELLAATPDEVRAYRRRQDARAEALSDEPLGALKARTERVRLEPGFEPPKVELTPNLVTALVFTDSTGRPWPVSAAVLGSGALFNVEVLGGEHENQLIVAPLTNHARSNLVVTLVGHELPLLLRLEASSALRPGRRVDGLVVYQVMDRGPQALPETAARPPSVVVGDSLYAVLDGLSPPGGRRLASEPALEGSVFYQAGATMFLRTPHALLWPAPRARVQGPGGLSAYEFAAAGSVLLARAEDVTALTLPGADLDSASPAGAPFGPALGPPLDAPDGTPQGTPAP
ncbi:MAG: DotH/IcmK family type IV secretion protein [Deltaproteobacteria bacterium]|jgi:intracellular multiplication protein IcmK|nr:DotH/IcmK family type IV secretion protein [Deltaproteobacteria bacterium]